ncbi:nitrate/nitrite transport system substrate-binding protein [Solimonas aquatica]|uniref:Nitrate/nitrite transport system substrate-binding protein n=1 Tax=Solimonas aquatica TaxID=489703 RepID=A0A1H9GLH8_9GAMM|nr:nitrate/nitrite transport system substrate-binding protein [Solimonas aquatica]
MDDLNSFDPIRRRMLQNGAKLAAAAAMGTALPAHLAYAAGAPEKTEIKIGFIPLTDCAPVVVAAVKGFDKKYGIKIVPSKEASWAAVRDKLINGENDASHVLYGLIYGVQMGIGGPKREMAITMGLNRNGQAITLSNALQAKGVKDGEGLGKLIAREKGEYTFAQTFPTGTHAMWLYYWLAANGVHPFKDVKTTTIPPPQMVANMRVGNMDGYCVGEPWNARAIVDRIGFTAITTQEIWTDHPEKVLGMTADFIAKYPNTARAMTAAVLDAARWCDAEANRAELAEIVADKSYVNTDVSVIAGRLKGEYDNGIGKKWKDAHYMRFFDDGAVNYPWLSDGMWFLTQHRRWGLLKEEPDYLAVAQKINRLDVYRDACTMLGISAPKEVTRSSKLLDGKTWDGKDAAAYAASFALKA